MRPSVYNEELASLICVRLAAGESLKRILSEEGMPSYHAALTWAMDPDHPFSEKYKRAREMQAENFADELTDIADDATNDWMERELKSGRLVEVPNAEVLQRSRLRVETRKWIASKLLPKKFGDLRHTEVSGSLSLEKLVTGSMDGEDGREEP